MSMRVMSAGDGYQYLLKSVVVGDGKRDAGTPLTRYYAEAGTPPGRWIGSGVERFGDGELRPGMEVTEQHLARLLGAGRDPVTGDQLGRAYQAFKADDAGRKRAVAGFDLTFSVPKSVSVLWGLSDGLTQSIIVEAHHAAIGDVIDLMEREIAATRRGVSAGDGAVAQVGVAGLAATAYDHWDSRSGDPQLHTHVVVSNKVKTLLDGRWRSLDSRAVHAAVVALSEHYNAVLSDRIAVTLGVDWEKRSRGVDRNPSWEISAVPRHLIDEFSSRSRAIDVEKDRLIATYAGRHGKHPSRTTIIKLRAQATIATRPEKTVRPLADLTAEWRDRASRILSRDAAAWARTVTTRKSQRAQSIEALQAKEVQAIAADVMDEVSEKRSTWKRWNLWAEASRQTMGLRFASPADREHVTTQIVEAAEVMSTCLTPGELASSPAEFRRADGTSMFRPRHSMVYSSNQVLAAEDELLVMAADTHAPSCRPKMIAAASAGIGLDDGQAAALENIDRSRRRVDVLIGPAGAGKTTAMNALRRAWEKQHGTGSVIGLAPSAVAAQVLADDLGIACENTAKWWQNHLVHGTTFSPGQLVIIDEASLAGTLSLDRITHLAEQAGAKVLLVGDFAQLQSVDAGGAFGLVVADRDDAPELVDVHRFTNAWEKTASLGLRHGQTAVIDTYLDHDRITDGDAEDMTDAAYEAWRADRDKGLVSVLIAQTREDVTTLNTSARADLILNGTLTPGREVELTDGTTASVGDTIITRRNDRRLRTNKTWVRNGDTWTIRAVRDDGSITIGKTGRRFGGSIVLPASYVAEHVDLGYAVTAHRAQGVTTDTAHVVVEPSTTRENFYVAMTRGRHSNRAYVVLDRADDHAHPHPDDHADATGRSVLYGVLQHVGAELSAHETITAEHEHWGSIAQLAAEYETIAAAAQHDRWATLIHTSGLTDDQAETVVESAAFGALTAELRRAEANHHDVDRLFPRLVAARGFADADDIAAVLHARLAHATARPAGSGRSRKTPRLIAGLIPEATGPMDDDMRTALDERRDLIEARAEALLDTALTEQEGWVARLGQMPTDMKQARVWRRQARVVAAYRDRYKINKINHHAAPLGAKPDNTAQKIDAARARTALDRARSLASAEPRAHESARRTTPERLGPTL